MMGKLLNISMSWLRAQIENMIKNKFDCIIFIEGNRGLGKSTFAYKLLDGLTIPIPFNPNRDLVYSREVTLKHIATKKGGAVLSDELINVAYNRDFYQEDQKILLKALNMYRDSVNVFAGCIPRFNELDVQLQRLCKIRITILRRGVALLQTKVQSIYSTDPWDSKNNQKIESDWTAKGTRNPKYAKLTTAKGIITFGDLTPKQRETYEAIKTERRGQVFGEFQDNSLLGNPEKLFYTNLLDIMKQGKVTPEGFDMLVKVNNKKAEDVRRKINHMLKEQGEENRWKDYVLSDKQKDRKDRLGFTIKSQENIQAVTETTPQIEEGVLSDNKDRVEQPQNEQEVADKGELDKVFGFKT